MAKGDRCQNLTIQKEIEDALESHVDQETGVAKCQKAPKQKEEIEKCVKAQSGEKITGIKSVIKTCKKS